jgi:GlpG protein
MRLIGHLPDEASARTFGDFLYVQGIHNQAELEKDKGWAIWIQDEDQIGKATTLLSEFRSNPSDPKYRSRAEDAVRLRAEAAKSEEVYRKRLKNRRQLFRPLSVYGFGPLTFVLIGISVFVYIRLQYGAEPDSIRPIRSLLITEFSQPRDLIEIRHGEVWRLLTPIFIHFSLAHIVFNLLALRDLGSMVEARQSSVQLLVLTLVIGICSNTAEYYIGGHVLFGGMSGVLYGLMGYIWMRGKFDPGSGLYLHPTTVTIMIVWFFACLLGFFPNVANTAHGVGLGMGMLWGWVSSLRYR